ncbi:GIY-YIG nuclease family protein [Clostridium perfringens]|uniref:GIY-YIG nuclease family protein n=1 Tax=Clostridium perfringens TaxID=1502 RepID=UPI0022457996|nr:GIY-YIG nuclease family protein [Clostridium perfringens]MCX0379532.1 GIY-YIG nuclease family protein [Clostridium perfringens]
MKEPSMNIKIDFFQKDLINSIDAGIYEISIIKNGKSKSIYIGESVYVIVRCAEHLYELNKNPKYFGFTEDTIKDQSITLKFSIIEKEDEKSLRKKRETQLIKEKKPLSQSGINDYQKSEQNRILALTNFLKSV